MISKEMKIPARAEAVTPFYVMDLLERAKKMEAMGEDVVHLEVGEPDFETPSCIRDAARRAIEEGKLGYAPSLGLPALREAIAARYEKLYAVSVSPERVIVTSGSSPALQMVFASLIDSGDEVIMTDPHYACYSNFVRFFGGTPVFVDTVEEENFSFTPEKIEKVITGKTKAILINSPANPTGAVMPEEDIRAVAGMGVTVVSDEIYQGLTYEGAEHTILEYNQDAFVVDGFSKRYSMTGWRLGYAVVPEGYVRPLQRLVQNFFISAPTISQWGGLAALEKGDQDVELMKREYDSRRCFLLEALERIGLKAHYAPSGAFYMLVNMRRYMSDSLAFSYDLLEKAKVAVAPGIDFGNGGEGYVRLSYATSTEKIKEGLRRIEWYLKGL
jgi:(5-formylfuran-3-yl)methyl phosphate transaminase